MTDREFEKAALACRGDDEVWALAERQAAERAGEPGGPVLAWVFEASRIRGELDDEVDYDVIGIAA